ncbi:MAG: hypothetical protein CMC94_05220 [Flavobacteriales bacterium]|nr:hypothetical protein [Flavobacteriales bacterium]|tara:strand:- start:596 stop:826 length:231 start_codon:yes stop_codon:yes gene_type:complete
MKKTIVLMSLLALCFYSCKDKCKKCTYKVYIEGNTNQDTLETSKNYCGEILDAIENEPKITTIGTLVRERECISCY